jgi:hypothetical protein
MDRVLPAAKEARIMKHHPLLVQAPVADKPDRNRDWLSAFDAHAVLFLVLDTLRDQELYQQVQTHPSWAVVFRDGESVLLSRAQTPVRPETMDGP